MVQSVLILQYVTLICSPPFMNHNKRVVVFTLVATSTLFFYSLFASVTGIDALSLHNVNILSDVLVFDEKDSVASTPTETELVVPATDTVEKPVAIKQAVIKGERSLSRYTTPKIITNFLTDTSKAALPALMGKLADLKKGKKTKVRIAWFGDSMIEGDLLSQTFRKRMQEFFGNRGVGFVPATSICAGFRGTVAHKWKGDWKEENFKSKEQSVPLFLSGHTFFTSDGEVTMSDATVRDTTQPLEKSLICGAGQGGNITITVNGKPMQFVADKQVNRILLDSSSSRSIDVAIRDNRLPVYGISMEPRTGVVVDNFSFRGITGLELGKLDSSVLSQLEQENPYDLVILEYGANLMFRPDDMDYSWYQKHIVPVLRKLQRAMPNTEFLIISTADRAFRYDETWKTAVGMNNLVKVQAELAYNSHAAFYNMYASMGGNGTMVSWADRTPSLANKDYIHPNHRGAEFLGNMLYESFMKDFRKVYK